VKAAACTLALLLALGAGALIVGLAALIAPRPASDETGDLSSLSFQPHPGAQLPLATKLIDERGATVALSDYFIGSPVIVVLDYLRCRSLCGVTMRNLLETLARLPFQPGRDYRLVSVSIDPRDTPADAAEALTKYAGLLGRRDNEDAIHFLTASAPAAHAIADAVGFPYRYDALLDAYIHPAGFVVAAPNGVISRYLEGAAASPGELVDAFASAEQDRSQGPLTRLLLLCHVQGAPIGRLTVPVLAAFMGADLAAGFALIAIFTAIRRRRHA
jgi:protein SCO1